jgi:Domain of unknown function (DUF4123)
MNPLSEKIDEILFASPAETPYAIVDGASVEDLLPQLHGLKPAYQCLYRGEMTTGVEVVAPYLVRLDPGSPFLSWLLKDFWGKHFGIIALADAELLPMRLHLRRHLRVYTEDGAPKLFRFYDPRVFRTFAPTILPQDAAGFFGPVTRFLCENKAGDGIESFRSIDGEIKHEAMALEPGAEWKVVKAQ